MAIKKPSDYFKKDIPSLDNSIQDLEKTPELNTFSDAFEEFKNNLGKIEVLSKFSETLGNYEENIEKVNYISQKIEELQLDIEKSLKKEDLDRAMMSQLLVVENSIREVQNKVKGINEKNLKEIRSDVTSLIESVNEFFENDVPKYKKLIIDSELRTNNRYEELEENVSDTFGEIQEFIEEKYENLQKNLQGINEQKLAEIISDFKVLDQSILELKEQEIPKYKGLIFETELKTESKLIDYDEKLEKILVGFDENIQETISGFDEKVESKIEGLQKSIEEVNNDIIILKEQEIPKYKNFIVETELKTEVKLTEFDEKLNQTLNDVIKKINLVEGDKTHLVEIVNDKIQEIQNIKDNVVEDLKVSEDYKKEINKKVSDLEIEIIRNESHIKIQNENLEQIQENVRSAIQKLNFEEIEEQNYELGKKVKYLEEIFDKFSEEKILTENIIVEPPSTNNKDSLTPIDQNFVTLEQLQQHYRLFINRIQQQLATIGGGGETRFEFLDDVDRDSVKQDGYIIQYSSSSGKFIGTSYVPGGGGGGGGSSSQWVTTSAGIHTLSNVGIGTTNPTSALDVVGGAKVSGVVTASSFSGNASSATYATNSGIATYATSSGIATYATTSGVSTSVIGGIGSIAQLQVTGVSTFTNGPVLIGTAISTGIASQRLQVTGDAYVSGKLGIGSTAPGVELTVIGTIQTGSATIYTTIGQDGGRNIELGVGSTTFDTYIDFQGSPTYTDYAARIIRTSGDNGNLNILNRGTGAVRITSQDTGAIDFATTNILRHRINSDGVFTVGTATSTGTASQIFQVTGGAYVSGNLGIGTTNPTSRLMVFGDGNFTGVVTATTFSGNATSATYATSSGIATYATNSGIATYATSSGISTYSISSGISTYSTSSGISTSVIGGIASVTQLNVSGVTTLGILTVGNVFSTGIITATTFSGNATSATYATTSGIATYATSSGISTYATSSGVSTSVIGGIASVTQLNVSGITTLGIVTATSAFVSGIVTTGTHNLTTGNTYQINGTSVLSNNTLGSGVVNSSLTSVGTLGSLNVTGVTTLGILTVGNVFSTGIITATSFSGNATSATYATSSGIATYAINSGIATYATSSGISTYSTSSGISTYATTSGIATYATSSGVSTSVIGGIASVTQLNVSGVTTLGVVTAGNIFSTGIITATKFVGDGSLLTGIVASGSGIIIRDDGVLVGTTTSIDFGANLTVSPVSSGVVTVTSSSSSQWVTTAAGIHTLSNVGIGTTNPTSGLTVFGDGNFTGVVTATTFSGNATSATYATSSGIATYATNSGIATYATSSGIATYATSSGIATYATNAGISTYATSSGIATYATNAGISTYSTSSGISTSVIGGIASVTQLSVSGISTVGFITATGAFVSGVTTSGGVNVTTGNTYQINGTSVLSNNTLGSGVVNSSLTSVGTLGQLNVSGVTTLGILTVGNVFSTGIITATSFSGNATSATYATTSGIATYATNAGISTYATSSGIATYATSSGISTYATSSGVSTSVIGGIASVTQLNVSGVTTLGIVTATSMVIAGITTGGGFNATTGNTFQINGTSVLSNNTLGTGVVNSSLTSVGTLGQLNVSGVTTLGILTVGNVFSTGIITATSFSGNATSATYATSSGIATYATSSGIATYATSSGVSTSVIGGIASVTQLNVSGVTTVGFITATSAFVSGIVTTGTHNLTTGNTYQINGTNVLSNNTLGTGVVNSSLTSVGTLGQLNVSGVTTVGFITATSAFVSGIVTTSGGVNVTTGNDYEINSISVLTSTTLGTGVVNSSLTSVGTLGQLNVSGVTTLGILTVGNVFSTGIITATSYRGDGSQLTGIVASGSGIIIRDDGALVGTATSIDFGANLTVSPVSSGVVTVTASGGSSSQWVTTSAGIHTLSNVGIGTTNPRYSLEVGSVGTSGTSLYVNGDIAIASSIRDSSNVVGAAGSVLTSTSTGIKWNPIKRTVGVTVDGGGSGITTGTKGYIEVPYSGIIEEWKIVSDISGSIVFDVWKSNAAIPTNTNTITASAKPTLTTSQRATSTTLTGWTTIVSENDVFGFEVESASSTTKATLILVIRQT